MLDAEVSQNTEETTKIAETSEEVKRRKYLKIQKRQPKEVKETEVSQNTEETTQNKRD